MSWKNILFVTIVLVVAICFNVNARAFGTIDSEKAVEAPRMHHGEKYQTTPNNMKSQLITVQSSVVVSDDPPSPEPPAPPPTRHSKGLTKIDWARYRVEKQEEARKYGGTVSDRATVADTNITSEPQKPDSDKVSYDLSKYKETAAKPRGSDITKYMNAAHNDNDARSPDIAKYKTARADVEHARNGTTPTTPRRAAKQDDENRLKSTENSEEPARIKITPPGSRPNAKYDEDEELALKGTARSRTAKNRNSDIEPARIKDTTRRTAKHKYDEDEELLPTRAARNRHKSTEDSRTALNRNVDEEPASRRESQRKDATPRAVKHKYDEDEELTLKGAARSRPKEESTLHKTASYRNEDTARRTAKHKYDEDEEPPTRAARNRHKNTEDSRTASNRNIDEEPASKRESQRKVATSRAVKHKYDEDDELLATRAARNSKTVRSADEEPRMRNRFESQREDETRRTAKHKYDEDEKLALKRSARNSPKPREEEELNTRFESKRKDTTATHEHDEDEEATLKRAVRSRSEPLRSNRNVDEEAASERDRKGTYLAKDASHRAKYRRTLDEEEPSRRDSHADREGAARRSSLKIRETTAHDDDDEEPVVRRKKTSADSTAASAKLKPASHDAPTSKASAHEGPANKDKRLAHDDDGEESATREHSKKNNEEPAIGRAEGSTSRKGLKAVSKTTAHKDDEEPAVKGTTSDDSRHNQNRNSSDLPRDDEEPVKRNVRDEGREGVARKPSAMLHEESTNGSNKAGTHFDTTDSDEQEKFTLSVKKPFGPDSRYAQTTSKPGTRSSVLSKATAVRNTSKMHEKHNANATANAKPTEAENNHHAKAVSGQIDWAKYREEKNEEAKKYSGTVSDLATGGASIDKKTEPQAPSHQTAHDLTKYISSAAQFKNTAPKEQTSDISKYKAARVDAELERKRSSTDDDKAAGKKSKISTRSTPTQDELVTGNAAGHTIRDEASSKKIRHKRDYDTMVRDEADAKVTTDVSRAAVSSEEEHDRNKKMFATQKLTEEQRANLLMYAGVSADELPTSTTVRNETKFPTST
eukprot:TRINITY_DN2539_c0_g1_i1.p1 TRINITY_DN2539_c0_g1~~TRINITY_DN2539_c0_g1_i1.p1  ORF type:complete len:1064 (+),score=280.18 TRINITY_DN2539_c0_g1_i1:46-3192(+)